MYIKQKLLDKINKFIKPGRVIVIYGPRRVGKTTLVQQFVKKLNESEYKFVSGDNLDVHPFLASQSLEKLHSFIGSKKILIIDEAQKIPYIGENLKLICDHSQDVKVIATGSSSFGLNQQIGEPLTGRKFTFLLFPLAQMELAGQEDVVQTKTRLEERLIYGSYPEIIITADYENKIKLLKELVSAYLCKDILELEGVRYNNKVIKLLQLLALQIGKEVSLSELANNLEISRNTVVRYLDLLEKSFVIINVKGFSRNLRKEIYKNSRYYFYDNGVRNALLNNFNPLDIRDDKGMLWENYVIIERLKKQTYKDIYANNYFWRTYSKQEIDWVEERGGKLFGYEISWQEKKKKLPPSEWLRAYPNAEYQIITPESYLEFIV